MKSHTRRLSHYLNNFYSGTPPVKSVNYSVYDAINYSVYDVINVAMDTIHKAVEESMREHKILTKRRSS